jgi:hypothetical protein
MICCLMLCLHYNTTILSGKQSKQKSKGLEKCVQYREMLKLPQHNILLKGSVQ